MAKKDQDKKSNRKDEDKDFGLPEIEITPISSDENKPEPAPIVKPVPEAPKAEESPRPEEPNKEEDREATPPVAPVAVESPSSKVGEGQREEHGQAKGEQPLASNQEEKRRSKAWLLILLIFLLGIIGYSVYYFTGRGNEEEVESVLGQAEETVVEEPIIEEEVPEEEVGETASSTPNMTEISQKGEEPRYLVTVGAFIDGDLAKDFSDRLNKNGYNTFLVLPGYGSSFYKLAIADFDNVDDATALIEIEQGNFEETLWVFKY